MMKSPRLVAHTLIFLGLVTLFFVLASLTLGGSALAQDDDLSVLDELAEGAPESAEIEPGASGLEGPGDLGGLEDLDRLGGGLGGLDDLESGEQSRESGGQFEGVDEEEALTLSFNGYVKPLAVWEFREYPADIPIGNKDRFTTVGARTQILLQGSLRDKAQFFTAANLDFNEVDQTTDTVSSDSGIANVRMVEAYIDLFGSSTRWRIGSQLVTWGFMDGFEVPTDRLNARDFAYKSSELEDLKLASTGIQYVWNLAAHQRIGLFYIPVGKVNRLSPDFENIFQPAPDDEQGAPTIKSGDSKYALHYSGTVGRVDYALSYVDGTNPVADLGVFDVTGADGNTDTAYYKTYHRYSSPGLDLQINFGAFLGRLSAVWVDTGDVGNRDPLRQNDWQQIMVGAEFWMGSALVNLNAGQKTITDYDDDEDLFFNNVLLGQFAETTNIVAGLFTDSYLPGAALEISFLFSYATDAGSGDAISANLRPSLTYNLGDGLTVTVIPAYSDFIGITTQSLYLETKLSF